MLTDWPPLTSPTATHTFDVPISRPTMICEPLTVCLFPGQVLTALQFPGDRRGEHPPHRYIVRHGQIHRLDGQSKFLPVRPDACPSVELPSQAAGREIDLPPVAGGDPEDARLGQVDHPQIHHAGQRRTAKLRDESKRGL